MARFSDTGNSPLKIYTVGSGEFFIVGSEHNGMIIQYNAQSNNQLGIGSWDGGYQVAPGTVITISTVEGGECYLNLQDYNMPIWGAGWNTTYPYWYLPTNTIATLVKLDNADTWIISGAGLGQD